VADKIGREQRASAQYNSAVDENQNQKISHTNQVHKQNERDEHTSDALTLSAVVMLPSGQKYRQCEAIKFIVDCFYYLKQ